MFRITSCGQLSNARSDCAATLRKKVFGLLTDAEYEFRLGGAQARHALRWSPDLESARPLKVGPNRCGQEPVKRATASLLTGLSFGVVTPVAAASAYLAVLTIAALARPRRPPTTSRTHRFAVLVPAHDEEAVIGRTLDNLATLDYPKDAVRIHVVADNCSDSTAAIARRTTSHVHERFDPDEPGKGAALNWLIDIIEGSDDIPDVYAIVDADTVLDPAFLAEMNRALAGGARVAQGYYSVLAPASSPAASLRFAALACRHHVRPLGRTRLGASCGLYGNGMVLRRDVMRGRRWSGHLVEDAEFQMDLLLDGIDVSYVPTAVLRAEMPDSLAGSETQNQRWERGRIELARRYIPRLATGLVAHRKRRIAYSDAIADHLVPPVSVLLLANIAATTGAVTVARITRSRRSRLLALTGMASISILVAHVVAGLALVRAPRQAYLALLRAPTAVLWKSALWSKMLMADDIAWKRTPRNDAHRTLADEIGA